MDRTFTLNTLPVLGAALILLMLLLTARTELFAGMGCRLPAGGWRYYIGSRTVLYIVPGRAMCRVYVLEGEPPDVPVFKARAGTYFKVRASSPVQAEMEIERLYSML